MMQTTNPLAAPLATLEISDRRLPARMVARRLRADLPRHVPLTTMPPRRRVRLAMLLLMLVVPVVRATQRSQAA